MKQKKPSSLTRILGYAGGHKNLTILGCILSALSAVLGLAPYLCVWLVARSILAAWPSLDGAGDLGRFGWMAVWFAIGSILLYFAALMSTHIAAFRTARNIRRAAMTHVLKLPLGFFTGNQSGRLRKLIDDNTGLTEDLLAHKLPDLAATAVTPIAAIVVLFLFDWRMGLLCLLTMVLALLSMCLMMGGKNAQIMAEYQAAQDRMTKAGTEYVRGIPVVKIFQQTVYSFKAFQQAIEEYSAKAEHYQADVCRTPQSINLTVTEGAFVFLVPAALFLAPGALAAGSFAGFVTDFAFYAVFSAIISTALARIMFASSGIMLAGTALGRIRMVMEAPALKIPEHPKEPQGSRVEFRDVSFTYDGAETPALSHVSFTAEPGQTVALVGPSGGGKTTAASLIPRFWDVSSGAVLVVDELGGFVISLLSGHIGGANDLTERMAEALGATAVVTTATDVNRKFSVDAWAARNGCAISSMGVAKAVSAAILEGPVPLCSDFPIATALPPGTAAGEDGPLGICISWRRRRPFDRTLLLMPRVLHLGIGCRRGAAATNIRQLVDDVLTEHQLSPAAVKLVASIDLKRQEPGLLEFCRERGWTAQFYTAAELAELEGDFTSSEFVRGVTGVDNVCERAALLGAGRLLVRKTARCGVTVAVAAEDWEVRFG